MSFRGRRVLVTGATGFIGSHLVRRLVGDDARVFGVTRPGSDPWRLADTTGDVTLLGADLRDLPALRQATDAARPEYVFHLGSTTDQRRDLGLVDETVDVNYRGTLNVLRACERWQPARIVHCGTCEEYGDGTVPFEEGQLPRPVSPYSASKAAATFACLMVGRTTGLATVVVRPFLTYGPAQAAALLVPSLIVAALTGRAFAMTRGEQTREFNHVDDVVEGVLRSAQAPGAVGEVINIGCGVERRVRDVAELILELTGRPIVVDYGALPYRPGENFRFFCDNGKARRLLGWTPRVGLEDGLAETVAWYKTHLDRYR